MKMKVNVYYALVQCSYWMGYAALGGFTSAYLLNAGLDNGVIGIILAIAGALAALVSPFVGQIIDRNERINNKFVLLIMTGMVTVLSLVISFWTGKPPLVEGILFGAGTFILLLSQPFTSALAMATINSGYHLDFGPTRAMGALGYAVASAIIGQMTARFGITLIPTVSAVLFFLTVIMLVIYPVKEKNEVIEQESNKTSALDFLKKYKLFSVMLVGMTLLYFSHMLINTFVFQIIQTKGGDSDSMGIAIAIAAVCETFTMIFLNFYISKLKLYNIIRFSGISFILKILLSFVVPNVGWFYVIQIFQMFGWGFLAPGMVVYVNELVEENDKAQGQAFAGMTLTFGNVFAALFGGILIEAKGVNYMLVFGTIIAVLGSVVLWISTKPTANK